ncbi:ABC transporter ATP-binding protein [Parabacteroides sp. PF5-9]|uniref:ABC transporter ATP-binding protein n=1 Tax=Parabacteroides sp. PF5-9 TaxID=1742404 RepID=UPI002475EF5E|nr:ABC transporter ATP-binding protein [Parabacteroides sp. PF5-9]
MENMISLSAVCKDFSVGQGLFRALNNINLTIRKGEFTGLVGPSGSGKTTLLNIIGALDTPTSGEAVVLGQNITSVAPSESAKLRNLHIGFIFQSYNLLPVYTVYENVEFALLLQHKSKKQRYEAVMEALEWVGLTDKRDSRPSQLSGGESQRVAIARAMVKRPSIVLADEPSANLDADNSHHILQTMHKLNKELQTTFIFATHDEKVMQYLQRIISLRDGQVEKDTIIDNSK